jgi:hypothetical protein
VPVLNSLGMADNIQKLVIKIRPRIGGSQAGEPTPSTAVPKFRTDSGKLIPGTASGILEFKIEGDPVAPASVSNYIFTYIYPLNLYDFFSGVAVVEMAE